MLSVHPPVAVEIRYQSHPQPTVPILIAQKTGTSEPRKASTIPSVVEFDYSPTRDRPAIPFVKPIAPRSATELGAPIGIQTVAPSSPAIAPVQKSKALLTQTIFGLQQRDSQTPREQRLITQTRDGENQEFQITPVPDASESSIPSDTPPSSDPSESPTPDSPSPPTPPTPPTPPEVVELIADQQEYDTKGQIVTATGNVTMRFSNGVLLADRLRVNLPDRFAVAEGNVVLTRGEQTLKGERFEYFFVQDKGVVYDASGEIYQPSTGRDLSPNLPTDANRNMIAGQTLNERLAANQPLQQITPSPGLGVGFGGGLNLNQFGTAGSAGQKGGQVNRLRFQAERVNFDAEGWNAEQVRLTNDPFSPPELEVRADRADYYNVGPKVDEVKLTGSQVVLDQTTKLPFQDRLTIDRRDRQPGVISFGYDGEDRGGLFVQSSFIPIDNPIARLQIKPQYLIQKALFPDAFPEANASNSEVCVICPSVFGLVTDLDVNLSDRTKLINTLNFSNLNLDYLGDSLRAKLALLNKVNIGDFNDPHDVRVEYNYRERLFNGSLGFQTVNSSFGALLISPTISLGDPTFSLSYQASIQDIQADTDQADLLSPIREDNLVTLVRYQGAVALNKSFYLWLGDALPSTPKEGLKYSPIPVVPYLQLLTGVTGVTSFYSDGSSQPSITGSVGLQGQFGHFSQPYLDYTGFNLIYQQALRGDASPFLFDRFVDTQVLTWGITQQLYGPLRFGIQSAYSIDANKEISTDYFLEYSRRTYNFQIRYNPQLQVGSINLRISDFNWSGNPGGFEGTDIRPVIQGVTR
ncbi:MAG: DUF3769 domain-containing protein [Merismopediaceae bacterium]|nr:DUF3769 domain-containing protein [Merismopediaceae bacterium]